MFSSGHRIGTAEVEDALNQHSNVAESAVVGYPHDLFGEGIFAYVILKNAIQEDEENEKKLVEELKAIVKKKIATYATPHQILVNKVFKILFKK